MDDGEIVTYALGKLDDRGRMFVKPGDPVYEGMIVGIHSRDNDLVVNAVRMKQLTNFRGRRARKTHIKITPPIQLTLEYASSSSRTTNWSRSRPRASACASAT
jgi:GTP-binding protein